MPHSMQSLATTLAGAGVKAVVFRYDGQEGREEVKTINYLSTAGGFLSFQEIRKRAIPENEVHDLGLEMLERFKHDWAEDWGGFGELRWVPGKDAAVEHLDRREEEQWYRFNLSARELRLLTSRPLPAPKDIMYPGRLGFLIECSEQDGPVIESVHALEQGGESPAAKEVANEFRVLFASILRSLMTKNPELRSVVTGAGVWIHLEQRCDLELLARDVRYEKMTHTINRDCDITL
ncbi:hypothetical protein [Salipiger sp. PrR003]|uniref:hypothetical protein n=1 Tax=Salipiger sp. PrR003 TaxID=2706776 RepID=UPI0013DD6DDB|nr:hypothetical protein [Salipiger sp. PrR003]NDV50835.1 hypothetical protein [Salipiger sp. PrR003]